MSWNQSSMQSLTRSSGDYRPINSGPWEERNMEFLEKRMPRKMVLNIL